jgi:hypothetical protein
LAKAIAISPGWSSQAKLTFLARVEPEPVLGILCNGDVDPRTFATQAQAYERTIGRLRYIGYRDTEEAVAELGDRLRNLIGAREMQSLPYVAIPRGGLIVLGMLASMLDLPREQVGAGRPGTDGPVVIIDDCAQSGARFGAFLASRPEPRVIFAHLFSHPNLRAAVEAREPRVTCVAARDLHDDGPEILAENYADPQDLWSARLGCQRYWIGDCERLCFPWNEPERVLWDPGTQDLATAWKLVPPPHCFKASGSGAASPPDIQVQPGGRGRLRPAPSVLYGRTNGEIVVVRIDSGEIFRLPGSADAFWSALVATGDAEAACRRLERRYGMAAADLRPDLLAFCETLLRQGLLELATGSSGS